MKLLLPIVTILFISLNSSAQLNSEFINSIKEELRTLEEETNIIGLSIAIRRGDDVWAGQMGISNSVVSLDSNSELAYGSITKTFISAGIISMAEDGLLALDDPISTYLPSYTNIDSSVTIRQLLNHTSGIFNHSDHPEIDLAYLENQEQIYSAEDVLSEFILEPEFDKGTFQKYSNTNYILLGEIISTITERPFYEEIFERFEINDRYPSIGIIPFTKSQDELANLWFDLGDGIQNIQEEGISLNSTFSINAASGAFTGTATDLVNWGYDLYTGQILNYESMEEMFTFPEIDSPLAPYGLGVIVSDLGCGLGVGHGGEIIYTSELIYFPDKDLAIAVMSNDGSGIDLKELGGVVEIAHNISCLSDIISDVSDVDNNKRLVVYPNPTSDLVNVELGSSSKKGTLTVIDELGRIIHEEELQSNIQSKRLDQFTGLNPGIYVLRFQSENEVLTKKIVKQ